MTNFERHQIDPEQIGGNSHNGHNGAEHLKGNEVIVARPIEADKPNYRELALKGEYDPARDDKDMQIRLKEGVRIPFFEHVLPMAELLRLKEERGYRVHIVLPTREEGTKENGKSNIGTTIDNLLPLKEAGLVDTIHVIDSESPDDTVAEARKRAGVRVDIANELYRAQGRETPETPYKNGKGTNLALAAAEYTDEKDIVVYCDTDFNARASQVQGNLSPLIADPDKQISLAWMARVTHQGDSKGKPTTGGRATENSYKPNADMRYPGLTGIQQPICGLYALRGPVLEESAFPNGYRVETSLIIQTYENHGAEAFAQTFCGTKEQTGQPAKNIADMSREIADEIHTLANFYGRGFYRPSTVAEYPAERDENGVLVVGESKRVFSRLYHESARQLKERMERERMNTQQPEDEGGHYYFAN